MSSGRLYGVVCVGKPTHLGCGQSCSPRDQNPASPSIVTALVLGVALLVVACGGIALANVTTGGSPGFDVVSAGSAVQPIPTPPVTTPQPAPTPTPAPAPAPAPAPVLTAIKGAKRRARREAGEVQLRLDDGRRHLPLPGRRQAFPPLYQPLHGADSGPWPPRLLGSGRRCRGGQFPVSKTGFNVKPKPKPEKSTAASGGAPSR